MAVTPTQTEPFTVTELQQATRNRGMPLEALRYDVTPVGLHYLLVHFDIPDVDPAGWRLEVAGAVQNPLALSLDELQELPEVTHTVTLECAGNGRARMSPRAPSQPWLLEAVGTAQWTGTPLAGVLADAGLAADAVELVFTGADHGVQGEVEHDYARSLTVAEANRPEVLLAWAMNGRPLEPQHGAPLRLVVPGWYGMTSVKWLTSVTAVTEPFTGYQQTGSYRYQQSAGDPGTPVDRIRVRALMVPPGFPDFPDRRRHLPAGPVTVQGRAWCGQAPVARVEVAVDGRWEDAVLEPGPERYAWCSWAFSWQAEPGTHVLAVRATDADGRVQPDTPVWNYLGVGNNLQQTVEITVTEPAPTE